MAKTCGMCGYEPSKEDELKPDETTEDCPQCGGVDTVVDDESGAAAEPEEKT